VWLNPSVFDWINKVPIVIKYFYSKIERQTRVCVCLWFIHAHVGESRVLCTANTADGFLWHAYMANIETE